MGKRMHDESDLLASVRCSPSDDAPRLVYADWLEEQGQFARAELIRVQCKRYGLSEHSKHRFKLEKHETQLFRTHKEEWLGNLAPMMRSARFERVSLTANQFVQHAEDIVDRTPAEEFNVFQVSDQSAPKSAASDELRRVTRLTVHGERMSDIAWGQLLSSPYLNRLRTLELHRGHNPYGGTSIGILSALSRCPSLNGLETLTTSLNDCET